jgi:hypothetical protein
MQDLCGPNWRPTEVRLPFRKPVDTEAYRRIFKAPLRFDEEQAALVFPTRWLAQRLRNVDQDLQQEIKSLLDARGQPELADLVRRAVRAMLVNRKVSEEALAQALKQRTIAAAGLDVFEEEPKVHPGLLEVPNVVLTPHIGSASIPTRKAMAHLAADNLVAFFTGKPLLTALNPDPRS